jgi:hypothetical protein
MVRVARVSKWLLGLGAIALPAVTGFAYQDATRIRDIMATGTEANALVDGGKLGVRQVGENTYRVDIAWQDSSGVLRAAKGLDIVGTLGRQLVAGEAGDPPGLLVKYDPDAPGRAPVIVRQAALDQEANGSKIALGVIGGALCAAGFAMLAWFTRRRTK